MEYDSLADLVSFGVAPGLLAYRWGLEPWGHWGWLAASLFAACGALRLARFNVQSTHASKRTFVGLPIPAAANMVASTVLLQQFLAGPGPTAQRPIVLFMVYALALLMVSSVPYASFKDLDLRAQQPFYALVATIFIVKFVVAEPQIMLFGALLAYVGSGPVNLVVSLVRRQRRLAARQKREQAARGAPPEEAGRARGAGA
jgi:CDP-diacylglycerol--serine O-phosphatidyltransferase